MRGSLVVALVFTLLVGGCVKPEKENGATSTTSMSSSSPTDSCFYGQPGTTYSMPPGQVFCGYVTTSTTTTTTTTSTTSTSPMHQEFLVYVKCNFFDPASRSVPAGSIGEWSHECGSHTVTIHKDGDPTGTYVHDAPLDSGSTGFTFSNAAVYHVFCKPHSNGENGDYASGMVSAVTVT